MINSIKSNYTNPLTMMKNSRQAGHYKLGPADSEEKKQKSLEAEKQRIQNSLLLMKGTSGNGTASEENIKILEQKLEEITKEIKANRSEPLDEADAAEEKKEEVQRLPRRDTVTLSQMEKDSESEE